MESTTKIYSSKDVAKRLSIQPVTVRKYSQMLEDRGVSFAKDENGWRQYDEETIKLLEYLCNLKAVGKSLEEAVNHIAELYRLNLSIAKPDISLQKKDVLFVFIENQMEFNQKMMEQLERIEQRQIERDQNLMKAIRETQEAKKQLAATRQKNWWKFWE